MTERELLAIMAAIVYTRLPNPKDATRQAARILEEVKKKQDIKP